MSHNISCIVTQEQNLVTIAVMSEHQSPALLTQKDTLQASERAIIRSPGHSMKQRTELTSNNHLIETIRMITATFPKLTGTFTKSYWAFKVQKFNSKKAFMIQSILKEINALYPSAIVANRYKKNSTLLMDAGE